MHIASGKERVMGRVWNAFVEERVRERVGGLAHGEERVRGKAQSAYGQEQRLLGNPPGQSYGQGAKCY
eukprot:1161345-Pelagomonas_calceolata.AAC.11